MAQVLFMLKQVPKSLKTAIKGSKRRLLLGRKAIIKPESMLKRRDITLPKKVHVVMHGCECWTINASKRMLFNCGAGEDS